MCAAVGSSSLRLLERRTFASMAPMRGLLLASAGLFAGVLLALGCSNDPPPRNPGQPPPGQWQGQPPPQGYPQGQPAQGAPPGYTQGPAPGQQPGQPQPQPQPQPGAPATAPSGWTLPAGFPSALPAGLPTALPSGFPAIPGLPPPSSP